MDQRQLQFIDDVGSVFESQGGARMVGRVLGALMVSGDRDLTAEDLATMLGASRGAISTTTRQLVAMGIVRRHRKPGERKDSFRVVPHAWAMASRRKDIEIARLRHIFEHGLEAMGDATDDAREPMIETIEFLQFWEAELDAINARWAAYVEEKRAARHRNA